MPELIDKNALICKFCNECQHCKRIEEIGGEPTMCKTVMMIAEMPTVEAVPVRHGRWETTEDYGGDCIYRCSVCGEKWVLIVGTPNDNNMLYCPLCGAKMDGGAENG